MPTGMGFDVAVNSPDAIARYRRLDVRRMIARGEEPFARIRETLSGLDSAEGLELHAPFLPTPLIERLSSEGYEYRFESTGAAHWTVYFWRQDPGGPNVR